MTAINCSTIATQEDPHNVAGEQFLPPTIYHALIGYSGKSPAPQDLLNPGDFLRILAVCSELLLEGLYREEIPGIGIRLLLVLEDMLPEIRRMIICIRGPSEVLDGLLVRLEVLKLIGILKLPAIAMQLVMAFLSSSLFLGSIDPSLFGTTFKFLGTG